LITAIRQFVVLHWTSLLCWSIFGKMASDRPDRHACQQKIFCLTYWLFVSTTAKYSFNNVTSDERMEHRKTYRPKNEVRGEVHQPKDFVFLICNPVINIACMNWYISFSLDFLFRP
jgi:hypothetical protein